VPDLRESLSVNVEDRQGRFRNALQKFSAPTPTTSPTLGSSATDIPKVRRPIIRRSADTMAKSKSAETNHKDNRLEEETEGSKPVVESNRILASPPPAQPRPPRPTISATQSIVLTTNNQNTAARRKSAQLTQAEELTEPVPRENVVPQEPKAAKLAYTLPDYNENMRTSYSSFRKLTDFASSFRAKKEEVKQEPIILQRETIIEEPDKLKKWPSYNYQFTESDEDEDILISQVPKRAPPSTPTTKRVINNNVTPTHNNIETHNTNVTLQQSPLGYVAPTNTPEVTNTSLTNTPVRSNADKIAGALRTYSNSEITRKPFHTIGSRSESPYATPKNKPTMAQVQSLFDALATISTDVDVDKIEDHTEDKIENKITYDDHNNNNYKDNIRDEQDKIEENSIERKKPVVVAIYDFVSRTSLELSISIGDQITMISRAVEWSKGINQRTNEIGYFPSNYVEETGKTITISQEKT